MKNFLKLSALTIALINFSSSANAQLSANGTANAKVYGAQISIASGANLVFGGLIPSAAIGTVVISTAGVRTNTGGVTLVTATGFTPAAGTFTVTGDSGASYNITLPSSVTLNGTPSGTMTVNTFVSNPAAGTQTLTGGTATLNVGATLQVAANQVAGTYTGTYTVSVAYN